MDTDGNGNRNVATAWPLSPSVGLPGLVVARRVRPLSAAEDAARRPIGPGGAGHVHAMRLLPRPGLVALLGWRGIDHVVQPTVPLGRHLGGFRELLVDDPAPRHTQRPDAPALNVVAVPGLVRTDELASQRRVNAVGPGIAAPPAEDLADYAHASPRLGQRRAPYDTRRHGLSMARIAAADRPQSSTSGIALGCGQAFRGDFSSPTSGARRRKSLPLPQPAKPHPQLLPRVASTTTSSRLGTIYTTSPRVTIASESS